MNVLALEPYYGGSHQAFLDGWVRRSRHDWTLLTLPAHGWKWRMRHAPLTFARKVAELPGQGAGFDAVVCTDMLGLAELRGLVAAALRDVPAIAYFHENQLTYPNRRNDPRDLHFGLMNFTTAISAERVWFNSAYHRDAFCNALADTLASMPDHQHLDEVTRLRAEVILQPPPVEDPGRPDRPRQDGPLRIAWAARWEHDKRPDVFFDALERMSKRDIAFRVSVMGERFRQHPECFDRARDRLANRIDHWGFLPDRAEYVDALRRADVFVSTAEHEFFGLAAVEAALAGCLPVLPDRLAYPEVFAAARAATPAGALFYDGSPQALGDLLTGLAANPASIGSAGASARRSVIEYTWDRRIATMDDALAELAK